MAFTDVTDGSRVIKEGMNPVKVTLTDTCMAGDLIGFDAVTDNTWQRADANGKIYAELIAGQAAASGDTIVCYRMAVIGGITGVAGDVVYLSDTEGAYAASPVSSWNQAVGKCISTTDMYVCPSAMPISVYDGTGVGAAGYFRTELESGRTAAARFGGIEIAVKTINGSTVSAGNIIFGLYIFLQAMDTDAASAQFNAVRLEDGCSAGCHPESWFELIGGSVGPTYFANLGSIATPSGGAHADSGTAKIGDAGWLKLKTSSGTRYINMYTG